MKDIKNEKKEFDSGINMTEGNVPRLLLKFAFPTMGQQVVLVIQSLLVTAMAGHFVGSVALGAMAVTMPIVMIINAVAMGLTQSNSILISQAYGRRDTEEIRKIMDTSTILVIGVCLVMMTLGLFFANGVLKLIQTPAEIFTAANTILTIILSGIPFIFTQFLFFSSLRGLGDSVHPMKFQMVKLCSNIILLPILVAVLKMGIKGLGLSMVLSDVIAALFVVIFLRVKKSIIAPRLRSLHFIPKLAKMTFTIGFPSMIQQVFLNASVLFLVSLVNTFGHYATEGYGVGTRIDFLSFALSISICSSVSILSGQNMGVEKYERVTETVKWGLIFSFIISAPVFLMALIFPKFLMGLFVSDPQVIAVGAQYLRIIFFNYILLNVIMTFEGVPLAAGQTYVVTIITIIHLVLARVPLAWWLSTKTSLGLVGIWYAIDASSLLCIILMYLYFLSGKWKVKNLIEKAKA